jgi:hypothetical protein
MYIHHSHPKTPPPTIRMFGGKAIVAYPRHTVQKGKYSIAFF